MEICKYQAALLPEEWVLGKLDQVAAAELEEHLMTCEACQEAVEAARGLRRGLALVAAERAARPPLLAPARRRWLAVAALLPLAAGAWWLARHEQSSAGRLAAAQAEVARLGAATEEARQAGAREQQGRQAAEARGHQLELELQAARETALAAPAQVTAVKAAPLVDLPTFLLAMVRDRPAGPDLVLRRSQLGSAFHLALDLPDPGFDRFRVEIKSGERTLLARRGLAPSALDALLLTLPADFLPQGENRLTLYGEGPGRPEQELARFRIAVEP